MRRPATIPDNLVQYEGQGNNDPIFVQHLGTLVRGKAEGTTFASDGARVHVKLKGGKRLTISRSQVFVKRTT